MAVANRQTAMAVMQRQPAQATPAVQTLIPNPQAVQAVLPADHGAAQAVAASLQTAQGDLTVALMQQAQTARAGPLA